MTLFPPCWNLLNISNQTVPMWHGRCHWSTLLPIGTAVISGNAPKTLTLTKVLLCRACKIRYRCSPPLPTASSGSSTLMRGGSRACRSLPSTSAKSVPWCPIRSSWHSFHRKSSIWHSSEHCRNTLPSSHSKPDFRQTGKNRKSSYA